MGIKWELFIALLVMTVTTSACSTQAKQYDIAGGKAFFKAHRRELDRIVSEVSKCRGRGTLSIYGSRHVDRDSSKNITCPNTHEVEAQIHRIGVLWVNVSGDLPYGEHGPMGATFVLSSSGLAISGDGSAIYYFPEKKTNPFGDSVALAGTPGHWFFRYLGSGDGPHKKRQ